MTLFDEQFEQEAIERIRKFARIAEKMGLMCCVGFSGGKDSQVVLDLVRRSGIPYKAYFNHTFESQTTMQFIRKYYPDVIWRREQKAGWSDENVWQYIHTYNLPINPEYQQTNRVGCLICPKTNISRNAPALLKYPKLIDCIILARSKRKDIDWMIKAENKDYSDNKVEYICRWLNHSFRPFTKKQAELCEKKSKRITIKC